MQSTTQSIRARLRLPGAAPAASPTHDHPNVIKPRNPFRRILTSIAPPLAALALVLTAAPARAGISFDAASSASQGGGLSTIAWTHTVSAGADRMLVVGITTESNPDRTVTSVTFGTQALTQVSGARAVNGGTTANATDLWYLAAPDVGIDTTITVTFSDIVGNGIVAGAVSLFGVVQGAPEAVTSYSAGNSASPYAVSIAPLTDGAWLVDAVNNGTVGASLTPGPDQTTQWYNGGANHAGACSTRETRLTEPASSVTDTWTSSGTSRRALSVAAFAPMTPPPPAADIVAFDFGVYGPATIDQDTAQITITVPYTADVAHLAPTYTTSIGATCPKASGSSQDFTSPVHYVVSSAAPVITKTYTVTVNISQVTFTETLMDTSAGATGAEIQNDGTLIRAYRIGETGTRTVHGVTFQGAAGAGNDSALSGTWGGAGYLDWWINDPPIITDTDYLHLTGCLLQAPADTTGTKRPSRSVA